MMVHAMRELLTVANSVGIIGFFVDAKDREAVRYYQQYGFIELPDNPLKLFLPLATLAEAFRSLSRS